MNWLTFVAGAVVSRAYGAMLHQGQVKLETRCARCCVGVAYFLIGVLVPVALIAQGQDSAVSTRRHDRGDRRRRARRAGAVCIIFSFRTGGTPTYVMPFVFGGAPPVNVFSTMYIHPPKAAPNPLLYVGFLITAVGAGMVLYFKPQAQVTGRAIT